MSRNRSISVCIIFLLASAVSGLTIRSQEPAPPSPDQSKPKPAQEPLPDKPEEKKDPAAPAGTEITGKSRLERETGTVNDRIFTVMPNYGTVENASELPPLSTGQKYRIASASVFDWFAYPFNAALAGIAQAKNDPKSWGQGWGAYGKRFGSSFADNSIGTYMTVAVFPSLLKEDPRYYQMGKGGFKKRAWHGVERLFVTRTDSGHDRFNYSESVGNAVAAGISNVYHAPEDHTFNRNITTFALLIMWDGLSNEMKEFWPDVRRKVFHKNNP